MRVIRKRCLGLDLHKKQITAHLRVHRGSDVEPDGIDIRFGTMPEDLEQLRQWVISNGVSDVVMESTSVYWMRVYELLEGVTRPTVVNAAHVKKVPGRKTDTTDAQWLAELHAHGLLRLSFVPPKEVRELRMFTRYRTKLVSVRTATRNRTIKLLEIAGIKLSSVTSDSFGVTGRSILDALAGGKVLDAASIEAMARGLLRNKIPELTRALGAPLTTEQREMLGMLLAAYDATDARIAEAELKMTQLVKPYQHLVERLDQVPGVNALAAVTLLAETGFDMTVYRNDSHLTALAGLAPGNAISADTRRKIAVRKGNLYLKRICVQIAWAASRKKDSFLRARFGRLQTRIGRNRAIVALARQILVLIYHMLKNQEDYRDLGAQFYDARDPLKAVKRYTHRIQLLGFDVVITPKPVK